MKHFSRENLSRHKEDIKSIEHYSLIDVRENIGNRDLLVLKYSDIPGLAAMGLPKSEKYSGILNLEDMIQEGYLELMSAVEDIDEDLVNSSSNPSKSVKSYLFIRVKNAVKRFINQNRSMIRLPEPVIENINKSGGRDYKTAQLFFNTILNKIKEPDKVLEHDDYQFSFMVKYINGFIDKYLDADESKAIRMYYGFDGVCYAKSVIAAKLGIEDVGGLLYAAIDKLSTNIDKQFIVNFDTSASD